MRLKSQRLYAKIGGRGARYGKKPERMHWRTFLRRLRAAKKSENRAKLLALEELLKAEVVYRRHVNRMLGFPVSEELLGEYELATERFLAPLKQITQ